jgi:hypothetical protein
LFNIQLNSIDELIDKFKKIEIYDKIIKLSSDIDLIKFYCINILYHNIYYYNNQLNISGIDLANSNYFYYFNGFTGTPENRFNFIDINPLNILAKNNNSICVEKNAIKNNCEIINYSFLKENLKLFNENYNYIDFIFSKKVCVIYCKERKRFMSKEKS